MFKVEPVECRLSPRSANELLRNPVTSSINEQAHLPSIHEGYSSSLAEPIARQSLQRFSLCHPSLLPDYRPLKDLSNVGCRSSRALAVSFLLDCESSLITNSGGASNGGTLSTNLSIISARNAVPDS